MKLLDSLFELGLIGLMFIYRTGAIIINAIKKFLKFLVSEEFNQQAMIFKVEKEMEQEKRRRENE